MKRNVWGVILGIIGGILALIGGITKHAYTTGSSYFVTAAEEQAIIGKAEACMYIDMYFSMSDPGPNAFAGNPVNPPMFPN